MSRRLLGISSHAFYFYFLPTLLPNDFTEKLFRFISSPNFLQLMAIKHRVTSKLSLLFHCATFERGSELLIDAASNLRNENHLKMSLDNYI